jgi:hypothetical protein
MRRRWGGRVERANENDLHQAICFLNSEEYMQRRDVQDSQAFAEDEAFFQRFGG